MYETKIKKIADYYGLEEQLIQTAEESSELAQAALKHRRRLQGKPDFGAMRKTRENLLEEMADTLIMIEQLCYMLNCEQKIKDTVIVKLNRQLERIGKEAQGWHEISQELPDENVVVETKIDDGIFVRNIQKLKRTKNLWFFPDGSMHVYYTPTHWRKLK